MKNNKGMGLLGLLIAVIIMAVLLSLVRKRYAGQTHRVLNVPGVTAPAQTSPQKKSAPAAQPAPAPCNGRRVGNICVPTQVNSASLDAFEQMNK